MSENSAEDIENSNFRFHHHNLRLRANDSDPFVGARYKRRSAALYYHASLSLFDNEGTCQILEDKLLPYISLVDDLSEGGVNNYAEAALALAANAGKNDVTKWKSNLRKSRPVSDIIKKLTDCSKKCHEWKITDEDLALAAKKFEAEKQCDQRHCSTELLKQASCSLPFLLDNNVSKTQSKRSADIFSDSSSERGTSKLAPFHPPPNHASIQPEDGSQNNFSGGTGRTAGFGAISRPEIFFERKSNFENASFRGRGQVFTRGCPRGRAEPECNFSGRITTTAGGRGSNGIQAEGQGYNENSGEYNQNFMKNIPNSRVNFNANAHKGAPGPSHQFGSNNNTSRGQIVCVPNNSNNHVQTDAGMSSSAAGFFRTAKEELTIQNQKKYGSQGGYSNNGYASGRGGGGGSSAFQKRSLGTARRAVVHGKFVPPVRPTEEDDFGGMFGVRQPQMEGETEEVDERLKNIDPKMVETIRNEIMDIGAAITWDDIAGLEFAKKTIQEIVVWPLLRPDIFTGLRKPPKGLLLFGPPGTGKTLIGKCIASQSQSTFFSISASSLTSKWIGDGEKMVRALFAVARVHQPSVVFIDEIDSLLTQRSDTEHESSRRMKTEFLVQLDGAATGDEERILVVGATNRPQELDEAARRRLVKRLYIPLPEYTARRQIVERLMSTERCALTNEQIDEIATLTEGYSGADMKNLCQEASLGPIRSISFSAMHQITADQVRPICVDDFKSALQRVRASVSNKDLDAYIRWDKTYGMGSGV